MPCKDISEEYKLSLTELENFKGIWGYKNTCGKNLELEKESSLYIDQPMMDLLEIRYDESFTIFKRKFLIAIKSILCEYLGFEKPYDGVRCEIIGIEHHSEGDTNILANIELLAPIEDIKPCANGCGRCAR